MGNLEDLRDVAPKQIWAGVSARVVAGERITLAIVELEPGAVVPEHRHDNEQLGFVIQGSIRFTVDGETRDLGPGGTWRILGGTPHDAVAGDEGAVVVDVFSPVRSDWDEVAPGPTRVPRWPGPS
jgi:quercetin dioxygenase-like cupin family protein